MYQGINVLFNYLESKTIERAKGKKAKGRENRRRKKKGRKKKSQKIREKREKKKKPNGMQMPTMWTNLGSYYYYS